MYSASRSRYAVTGSFPATANRASTQSARSPVMPSPAALTCRINERMPCVSSEISVALSCAVITPLRHNSLPSPITMNSAVAFSNSCRGAEASIPAFAENRSVLPSNRMRNTPSACVPTPRRNVSPAITNGVRHIDWLARAMPADWSASERSSSSSQTSCVCVGLQAFNRIADKMNATILFMAVNVRIIFYK